MRKIIKISPADLSPAGLITIFYLPLKVLT
jgi:hypothetical protein